jgi:hypothetical protein
VALLTPVVAGCRAVDSPDTEARVQEVFDRRSAPVIFPLTDFLVSGRTPLSSNTCYVNGMWR